MKVTKKQAERNTDHAAALDFQAEIDAAVASGNIYALVLRKMKESAEDAVWTRANARAADVM